MYGVEKRSTTAYAEYITDVRQALKKNGHALRSSIETSQWLDILSVEHGDRFDLDP
jgi:uncharacterized protein (DUF302 family)